MHARQKLHQLRRNHSPSIHFWQSDQSKLSLRHVRRRADLRLAKWMYKRLCIQNCYWQSSPEKHKQQCVVCICLYLYECAHACVYMYGGEYVHVFVWLNICACVYTCVCMWRGSVRMYLWLYICGCAYVCMCVHVCACGGGVCTCVWYVYACAVPTEAKRGHWIPWSWSYWELYSLSEYWESNSGSLQEQEIFLMISHLSSSSEIHSRRQNTMV